MLYIYVAGAKVGEVNNLQVAIQAVAAMIAAEPEEDYEVKENGNTSVFKYEAE